MKIFGVSLFTIALVIVAYLVGVKYPATGHKLLGGM